MKTLVSRFLIPPATLLTGPMLAILVAGLYATEASAGLHLMTGWKYSKTMDFESWSVESMPAQLDMRGVQLSDKLRGYGSVEAKSDATVRNESNGHTALSVEDGRAGVYMLFDDPMSAVGVRVQTDDREGTVLVEAFGRDFQSLGAYSLGALEDAWQFIGFTSDKDVAAIRIWRATDDATATGLRVDEVGLTVNSEGIARK